MAGRHCALVGQDGRDRVADRLRVEIGAVGIVGLVEHVVDLCKQLQAGGRTFLQVEPSALRRLTSEAMHDIAHYLRPAHLAQLRRIIDDPESSGNDRFVALDLLKNVNISAGGVLPMCQDTGTAIVMGK